MCPNTWDTLKNIDYICLNYTLASAFVFLKPYNKNVKYNINYIYLSMIKHSGLYYGASIHLFLALVNAFKLHTPYCINNVMRFMF